VRDKAVREKAARFGRRSRPAGSRENLGGLRDDVGRYGPPDDAGPGGPRRPLSHVGGRVERLDGPSELRAVIEQALDIDPEQGVRDHVHGFHSYPARLHPLTAGHLVRGLSPERGSVADPFCGCGTVLVEARRLGRKAIGVDLNPLAVRLTRFKTQPLSLQQRDELEAAAARVAEHAEERRLASAGPTHRYAPVQREAFDVHVLLELDGLAHGIKQEPPGYLRQSLGLALSSIFSKVGRDNSAEGPGKRLASGFTIRFFQNRVGELVRQLAEYEALLPDKAPGVQVREADARQLGELGLKNVDLFVSSPPYPGVLDYADYHRTRLSWLNIDAKEFERLEMGARRHLQRLDHEQAAASWEGDFVRVLRAMRDALAPEGHIALVLADSLLAGKPYPADVVVERCAARAGLELIARGSQRRPHFHRQSAKAFGDRPRYEHLLLLAPAPP
jgi:SAM-dependent methyltransferase